MGNPQGGGKDRTEPLQPVDVFSGFKKIEDPFTAKNAPKEITTIGEENPESAVGQADNQNLTDIAKGAGAQFLANTASSLGQGLANTFDLVHGFKSLENTAKQASNSAFGTDYKLSNDDFTSNLFGVNTKQMQDWANGVAQRNQILERDPDSFNPTDAGWWGKQIASSGTSLGMAIEALGTTAAIELATGGLGTAAAISKLSGLVSKIGKGVRGAEAVGEAMSVAKGLRSAATVYGVINRASESRMEAMQSYDEVYNNLSNIKNNDGTPKYSEEDKKHLASEGARRTYNWNLALMPLDILSYRTMVFNPISGSAEGLVEKGLSKLAGAFGESTISKAAGWTASKAVGTQLEGIEEGFQAIGSNEGKHYAQVLGGMDDGKSFLQRVGDDVTSDDFWNNYAGGVIGGPLIGGAMEVFHSTMHSKANRELNDTHKNFVSEVGKMDASISNKIKQYEAQGKTKEAAILRRQFGANKALSALHLDAMTDKDSAFDSRMTFLTGILGELNEGKTTGLEDLGIFNTKPEQLETIKNEFKQYIDDANTMKKVYDSVKDKYNKNFVPQIAQEHFQLESLVKEQAKVEAEIATAQGNILQYGSLSTHGKEIYNIEHELTSLKAEEANLNNQFAINDNSFEKENINKLIEENRAKQTALAARVPEISKNEAYTNDAKNTDADIINSNLKSKEYQQAIHDRNHLANAISLQRKNLALWNNSKYIKEKVNQSIKKAKTREQVEATEQNLKDTEGKIATDTQEAIDEKKAEIAAQEAGEVVDSKNQVGDNFSFEEDNSHIDALKDVTAIVTPKDNSTYIGSPPGGNQGNTEVSSKVVTPEGIIEDTSQESTINDPNAFTFAPTVYDFDNSSDEAKNKIKNGVAGLLTKVGDSASFEDLIRHVVKVQGNEVAENIYNALIHGWEANGKSKVDYDAVYDKVFGNPFDELMAGVSQLRLQNTKQLEEATNTVTEDVLAHELPPEGFDNDNQPIYTYRNNKGAVTNEASPKMAFSTRLAKLVTTTNEDGSVNVDYDYSEEGITGSEDVDSLQLLDPDKFTEGTAVDIKVPDNYLDIKVPVYEDNSGKPVYKTFGQYVAEKGLTPEMPEYQDKIPMVIYRKGMASKEKGVAFVHDVQWYHPIRFNQEFKDDMDTAIANTRAIRKEVLDNKGFTSATITGKRQTTFDGLRTGEGTTISLREANPDTTLTVAMGEFKLNTSKSVEFANDERVLMNNKPFNIGDVWEVRRYGTKDGKKTFMGFPVLRPKLDEVAKNSIYQAINMFANRENSNQTIRAAHDKTRKSIMDTMGNDVDIFSKDGLAKYLKHFMKITTIGGKDNADIERQAQANQKEGTPYFGFTATGTLVFGFAGKTLFVDNKGNEHKSMFINPKAIGFLSTALDRIRKEFTVDGVKYPSMLSWFQQNLDLENLNANKPIVTIDATGNASQSAKSYNDFLLDRLQTNVRSYNIGTKENLNYVTNIQPVITYDTNSRLKTTEEQPSNQEIVNEILPKQEASNEGTKEATDVQESSIDLAKMEAEALEMAKAMLGSDFTKGLSGDIMYAPSVLTPEQEKIVKASIDNIAGLTPSQQADIVNFMYNQVIGLVNLETKTATKTDVDAAIDKTFKEVLEPQKKAIEAQIADLEDKFSKFPSLDQFPAYIKSYKYRLSKIQAIEDNIDTLKKRSYDKVLKYTGISMNKQVLENEGEKDPETNEGEEVPENNTDFWTDVLTESPENKLSYAMRRFFGNIRAKDKSGKPLEGFLSLPVYEEGGDVIRKLMEMLADVPSNFDAMIAKLEESKVSTPYMEEVIAKLKGTSEQRKNQFVTVMSNTRLRMKFTMLSYNRKNQTWTTKVYDTALNGVASSLKNTWYNNLTGDPDFNLVVSNESGNLVLNKEKAIALKSTFENWRGTNLKAVQDPSIADYWTKGISGVSPKTKTIITPTGTLLQELKTNLVSKANRMKFSLKGKEYEITNEGNGKFQVAMLAKSVATKEQLTSWLKDFGITLSPETMEVLMNKGLYHNYAQRDFNSLFDDGANTNGLFGILYNKLKDLLLKDEFDFTEYGDNPLDNSVITSLANEEAKYANEQSVFGFRVNGKSYFALTAPKFITDRARDLKTKDSIIRQQLEQISFSKGSLWLRLLKDDKFRDKFAIINDGAESIKELGKKTYRKDVGITSLSDIDHELSKLGKFQDTNQGELSMETRNYMGTNVPMRIATMVAPTMSDKSIAMLITTAVLDLKNGDLKDGQGITNEIKKILYEQVVRPELQRMINFHSNIKSTDISAYDKGAGMFFFIPQLNNLNVTEESKLVDAIKNNPTSFTMQNIEANKDLMDKIYTTINGYVESLVDEKVKVWEKNGFVTTNKEDANKSEYKFFDSKYMSKFQGNNDAKVKMAAYDFVINNMVHLSNSFMMLAGDPAMYFKSKSKDKVQQAKDTFVNVGKRLANQIAPGTTLANSEKEQYLQVFIEDRANNKAGNIDYIRKLLGEAEAKSYENIDAADAQEYTTWKEHLNILARMGKTGDNLLDITPEEIQQARDLMSSGAKLNDKQLQLIKKVMQPIKPVYTGQIYDKQQDVMRTVYIKSSSFPLIPQLTAGFEIDKLRQALEKFEDNEKKSVRASYQTANKVGSINTPLKLWNEDGTANADALNNLKGSSLVLDRKNFRIQQEVPFKTGKKTKDEITLGTQLMKLLFGDEILNHGGFTYKEGVLSGRELHKIYNDTFISLVQEKRNQLFSELGLDNSGNPIDNGKTQLKLQKILKDEAINRGYPLQDVEGLEMDDKGNFILPLWSSSNSNRYESMLNAIVTNRLVKLKMPGNSYVVGSEEGFKTANMVEEDDEAYFASDKAPEKSKIIFTSAWNGKELQASYNEDGTLKKAQIFAASKFRDREGHLVDLMAKENGQYKYLTQESPNSPFLLKKEMFDDELLSLLSFRIPTSGLQSGSTIEIAGFLPHTMGDLMIVPKNFTKQKGLDFDVDKENTYQLNHFMNDDGKFEVLDEKHRDTILAAADKKLRDGKLLKLQQEYKEATTPTSKKYILDKINSEIANNSLINSMFAGFEYTDEDIEDGGLGKTNSKITEQILKNDIVRINQAIFSNPDDAIQKKIVKTLNTDFAEDEADYIENLAANAHKDVAKENTKADYWTPLSDEYQKEKMMLGSSGKIGTGAYSLDVVFHSLAQQAALQGNSIRLTTKGDASTGEDRDEQGNYYSLRFGNIKSDGTLGGTTTLDGSRTISDVMAERQNIAVDNEKLQIMGRVNLNDLTMDVDKVFNMLGFDKDENGHSISFLFLSQPIIKDYVAKMKNANSIMADFKKNKEESIVDELIAKYLEGEEEYNEEDASDAMDGDSLVYELEYPGMEDGQLQAAVLRRFIEMKKYGIALRGLQGAINTDSKGLGKSFFDVIEKRNALNKLGTDGELVQGASKLLGDYIPTPILQSERDELGEKGYINIGSFMVKPTTLSGAFSVHGVMTAYNLWSKYFPYDAQVTLDTFKEVLGIIGNEDLNQLGATKTVELKQEVFKGLKKYFNASSKIGIISLEDKANSERARIYIDSDKNVSLARYIKTIKQMNNPVVNEFIKTNKLLNRFEYEVNKDGQPSVIKYNNAAGEDFDEQYLYESMSNLLTIRDGQGNKIELPQVGNVKHTLDSLAQDLIAYSMLGNSTQEAIQFTKYIPVSYLNAIKYSEKMRFANVGLNTNSQIVGGKIMGSAVVPHNVSEFTMQFVQHNPEKVKAKDINAKNLVSETIEAVYEGKKELGNLQSFKLKASGNQTIFKSIYNPSIPKGEKKFQLYWFDGEKYTRVPVLGTFGMDEYQPNAGTGQSLINGRVRDTATPTKTINAPKEVAGDNFGINSGDTKKVIENIANSNLGNTSLLAKQLLPFIPDNIDIEFQDTVGDADAFDGMYNRHTNKIIVSPTRALSKGDAHVSKTVVHEVVHALTVNYINKYLTSNNDGTVTLNADAPAHVAGLVRLYNDVRSKVDTAELQKVFNKVKTNTVLSSDEFFTKYGLTDIYEFITMSLVEPEFQKYLSKEQFKQSGVTLLDKFKEIVNNILTAIGVKFPSNTAAAQAISSIFEVVEVASKENIGQFDDLNNQLWEESINGEEFNNEDYFDGNHVGNLSSSINPENMFQVAHIKASGSNYIITNPNMRMQYQSFYVNNNSYHYAAEDFFDSSKGLKYFKNSKLNPNGEKEHQEAWEKYRKSYLVNFDPNSEPQIASTYSRSGKTRGIALDNAVGKNISIRSGNDGSIIKEGVVKFVPKDNNSITFEDGIRYTFKQWDTIYAKPNDKPFIDLNLNKNTKLLNSSPSTFPSKQLDIKNEKCL